MALFSFFTRKKNKFFTPQEQEQIVQAIRYSEKVTSGEIRVVVESRCSYMDALDRAAEVFFKLEMDETDERNAVLIYVAISDRQFAIFADEQIHLKASGNYWNEEATKMLASFQQENTVQAIVDCVTDIGNLLQTHFPYNGDTDKNELPDEIVFGD